MLASALGGSSTVLLNEEPRVLTNMENVVSYSPVAHSISHVLLVWCRVASVRTGVFWRPATVPRRTTVAVVAKQEPARDECSLVHTSPQFQSALREEHRSAVLIEHGT